MVTTIRARRIIRLSLLCGIRPRANCTLPDKARELSDRCVPLDRATDQTFGPATLSRQSCPDGRASIKSYADIRHPNGKNFRRDYRFAHRKFSPRRGTSRIVGPTYRAAKWWRVDLVSTRQTRRACRDKNSPVRVLTRQDRQLPAASRDANSV